MLKITIKSVLILIILIFIIAQLPVSMAEQYGTIQGHAFDKYGNGIPGVKLSLQNGDYKTIATSVTGSDGSYIFSQVPVPLGNDIYRIKASLDAEGRNWPGLTGFFNVMAMRITSQDICFNDYPSSGIGCLYGVVSSDQYMLSFEPATVYLDNGMYTLFPGGRYDTWSFEKLSREITSSGRRLISITSPIRPSDTM